MTTTFQYDQGLYGKGKRTAMADGSTSSSQWTYDARGRLLSETTVISGIGSFATAWTYDAMDRVVTTSYPGGAGETVTTSYTDAGQPKSLTGTDTYVYDTTYTAWGALDDRTMGASGAIIHLDYTYYDWTTANGRGRLQYLTAGKPPAYTSLQNLEYVYDAVGNVRYIYDFKAGTPYQRQAFTYDTLNRLVSAQADGGTDGNYGTPTAESYAYSFAGNITSKAGVSYTYGDASHKHAVTAAGGNSYGYDANGNMTSRTVGGTSYTLSYDRENHLTSITGGVGGTFVYDGDGTRVKATVNSVTTLYPSATFEQVTDGEGWTRYYTIGGVRVAMRRSGYALGNGLFYLLGDHLGSTAIQASDAGVKSAEVRYKAWGENRFADQTTYTTYRFTGQREEAGLGLYYYGARWYDATLGRFVQADSITQSRDCSLTVSYAEFSIHQGCNGKHGPGGQQSDTQALNRYSYTLNNPVRYTDPDGHLIPLVLIGAVAGRMALGAVVGGAVNLGTYYLAERWAGREIDSRSAKIAFAAGATVGAISAIPEISMPALLAVGALTNVAQSAATSKEPLTIGDHLANAAVGAAGAGIGGRFTGLGNINEFAWGGLARNFGSGLWSNSAGPWVLSQFDQMEQSLYQWAASVQFESQPVICGQEVCPMPTPFQSILPTAPPPVEAN